MKTIHVVLGLYFTTISVVYLILKYSTIHFSHSGVNCSQSIKRCGRSEGTPYFFGDSMCHHFDPSFSRQANVRMLVVPSVTCQCLCIFHCDILWFGLGLVSWRMRNGRMPWNHGRRRNVALSAKLCVARWTKCILPSKTETTMMMNMSSDFQLDPGSWGSFSDLRGWSQARWTFPLDDFMLLQSRTMMTFGNQKRSGFSVRNFWA